MTNLLTVLLAAFGSAGFFAFLQFLITRHDNNSEVFDKINIKLDKLEKDSCRTQMLVLMMHYPEEKRELMKLARHYFEDLHGDWYFTDIFSKWLAENDIEKPVWFNG